MRRHVKIGITDIHYIGKETNELEEQLSFGFNSEAQLEYGMESKAHAKILTDVQQATKLYKLDIMSRASGISARYLTAIRAGKANADVSALCFGTDCPRHIPDPPSTPSWPKAKRRPPAPRP